MKIFLCWWCWAVLCCWIKILLNPSCPCQQPYFGLNTTGKHSNTTGKFEISRGDGDGAGEGVVELRFSWIHLAAVSSHLSPESACRDSRNSQTFFLKYTFVFSCTVLYAKIQHNEIHNIKWACVLKSNYIRSCWKCTITPADELWNQSFFTGNHLHKK